MKRILFASIVTLFTSCASNKVISENYTVVVADKHCIEPECIYDGVHRYHKPSMYDLLIQFEDDHREHQGVSSYTFNQVEIGDTIIITRYK